jgi:SAM-dependent methyltransferase
MFVEWAKRVRRELWIQPRMKKAYASLSVAEAFRKIYFTKSWGSDGKPFFSGAGSYGAVSDAYCAEVSAFIKKQKIRRVVDLGCGDFSVGRRIAEASEVEYIGVDIVAELIDYHKSQIYMANVSFLCANIMTDKLPSADLCLIRQVFQHLSNDEISQVLANVRHFPHILVSEELPDCPTSFNLDKSHGPDVRSYYGSGVYLERPPFSMPVKDMWTSRLNASNVLNTVLLEQDPSQPSPGESSGMPPSRA